MSQTMILSAKNKKPATDDEINHRKFIFGQCFFEIIQLNGSVPFSIRYVLFFKCIMT